MNVEEKELFGLYQKELRKCWEIAEMLDSINPDLDKAFEGSPGERISRQIKEIFEGQWEESQFSSEIWEAYKKKSVW